MTQHLLNYPDNNTQNQVMKEKSKSKYQFLQDKHLFGNRL